MAILSELVGVVALALHWRVVIYVVLGALFVLLAFLMVREIKKVEENEKEKVQREKERDQREKELIFEMELGSLSQDHKHNEYQRYMDRRVGFLERKIKRLTGKDSKATT